MSDCANYAQYVRRQLAGRTVIPLLWRGAAQRRGGFSLTLARVCTYLPVGEGRKYEPVTNKVVELRTPTSTTRFHAPNDKVEFEREKYEDARQERTMQPLRAVLPNPRYR